MFYPQKVLRKYITNCLLRNYHIDIPIKKKRASTDILNALSGTINRDETAALYKYHDDPYLIPTSNATKKVFAIAQESGRKAARWIKDEHQQLFLHHEAEPIIQLYTPKNVTTDDLNISVLNLKHLIKQGDVKDAIGLYTLMKEKGVKMDTNTQESLLELLCFYNCEEPALNDFIEERWFKQNNDTKGRHGKIWNENSLAERLYEAIPMKSSATYCALIRGFAKYRQAERAFALYEETKEKGISLDCATINSLISAVNCYKETADQRWEIAQSLLKYMTMHNILPDLYTMNSLLECISSFGNYKFARKCASQVLAEFNYLDVEPSLGTYYYILIIFCRDKAPVSHVLVDILDKISGKECNIKHPKDTFFFATAMDVCRNHLNDKILCKRLNELLHTGKNYDLIGDSYKEAVYYRHYVALLCQTENITEFMKLYDTLVPNIYTPEPGIMEEILKSIELNAAYHLMPRIWSDMVIFDHINRLSLLQRTINILVSSAQNSNLSTETNLAKQFAKISLEIFNKMVSNENQRNNLTITGEMIGGIMLLIVRGGNFNDANKIFNYLDNHQHSISGTPSESSLVEFVDACITNKSLSATLQCVEYAYQNHIDLRKIADKIYSGFTLNENQLWKLKSLVDGL